MKILQTNFLIRKGNFARSSELDSLVDEVHSAILAVAWPEGNDQFILFPKNKGNGVVPIKKNFLAYLEKKGWILEHRMSIAARLRPGPVDAVKKLSDNRWFAVEWETGNISSSHRAMNKMAIGLIDGVLAGGILILPSRTVYRYLTDRIGNYAELEPYFPMWRKIEIEKGILAVI